MTYTSTEQALLQAKRRTERPLLNLPTGERRLEPTEEDWIILLPEEVRQMLLELIQQTINRADQSIAINLRLAKELRDTQNTQFKQRQYQYAQELLSYNTLTGYLARGLTITGDSNVQSVPPDIQKLLNLTRVPFSFTITDQDSVDFERRLNDYIIDAKANWKLIRADAGILRAWLRVIQTYSDSSATSDKPTSASSTPKPTSASSTPKPTSVPSTPKPTSVPSASGAAAAPTSSTTQNTGTLSEKKKKTREIIQAVAQERKYPENRLLAQLYAESAYNPEILGPYLKKLQTRAAGVAQFIPTTGKSYGLNSYTADFFDAQLSSQGAVSFMRVLMKYAVKWGAKDEYEQWRVALGSYNAGPGNMIKAAIKAGVINGSGMHFEGPLKAFGWEDISKFAPSETQGYVTKIAKLALSPP